MKTLPVSATDTLLHVKDSDKSEHIVLPITRYANVLNAPRIVTQTNAAFGAPFCIYVTGETETMTTSQLRKLIGDIV